MSVTRFRPNGVNHVHSADDTVNDCPVCIANANAGNDPMDDIVLCPEPDSKVWMHTVNAILFLCLPLPDPE